MRTVFVLFDSLNRSILEHASGVPTPNFDRLQQQSVKFTRHYAGSLPCIPARRDLLSGRMGFLHRGWGPMEPYDESFPRLLRHAGVYSHLVTDHYHYFEPGGSTYHPQYSSYEFYRGQERDGWKGVVEPDLEALWKRHHRIHRERMQEMPERLAYALNRELTAAEQDMPSVRTFEAGLEFIETNLDADNWFLQIETFDPHEPFQAPDRLREQFDSPYRGPLLEWPHYAPVSETPEEIAELRANYAALVCLCDEQLGKILDVFDHSGMWDDTALLVSTDHGFLLGEHDWWGKGQMPVYEEIAHIPLYFHHPERSHLDGSECHALTQAADLMPTILELHKLEAPPQVHGTSLVESLLHGSQREVAIFGYWGSSINATDGRYSYFWYPENDRDAPLFQYTLMPVNMLDFFSDDDLKKAELTNEFDFTNGLPLLKVPYQDKQANANINANIDNPCMLFDLDNDPGQLTPIQNPEIEGRMKQSIAGLIRAMDAPRELQQRFSL